MIRLGRAANVLTWDRLGTKVEVPCPDSTLLETRGAPNPSLAIHKHPSKAPGGPGTEWLQ